jgi:hypothetical protein
VNNHICVLCSKTLREGHTPYYYESKILCATCYFNTMCVYCNPHVPLVDCDGHAIQKNPSNRFMNDKEFVDGMRFEYESERHLPPGSVRPAHDRSNRR